MATSRIYLDHLASSPLLPQAREAMESALGAFGNPTSQHEEGRAAKDLLEQARGRVARRLGCRPRDVMFTANGTLASQLALRGVAHARKTVSSRIVLTAVEHPAVDEAATDLGKQGFEIVRVSPSSDGRVEADAFLAAVGEGAALAAMMLANHETGILLPAHEVGQALRARGVPFLCDACLGPGRIDCTGEGLAADVIVHSAHKWGGPGGLGLLQVRRGTRIQPSLRGGNQEEGLHPGTENVIGAVGAAAALDATLADADRSDRYAGTLSVFLHEVEGIDGWRRVVPSELTLPGVATLELDRIEGEAAMINLDLMGVAVATGSACALGAAEPSATLRAMGMSRARAASTLRISTGEGVSRDDAARAGRMLSEVITRLRALGRP